METFKGIITIKNKPICHINCNESSLPKYDSFHLSYNLYPDITDRNLLFREHTCLGLSISIFNDDTNNNILDIKDWCEDDGLPEGLKEKLTFPNPNKGRLAPLASRYIRCTFNSRSIGSLTSKKRDSYSWIPYMPLSVVLGKDDGDKINILFHDIPDVSVELAFNNKFLSEKFLSTSEMVTELLKRS